MISPKTLALLGLGYCGYKLLENYKRRKAEQQYIEMMTERQAFVEEQLDRMHKYGKRVRFIEFQRQLDDFIQQNGYNPYLDGGVE